MELKTKEFIDRTLNVEPKEYDGEVLRRVLEEAQEWKLIDYRPFEDQGYFAPVSDLILGVIAHQKIARSFSAEELFVSDNRLGGVCVTTGRCDVYGGMGGYTGFHTCLIDLEEFRRTLYDYNAFDYTLTTQDEHEFHAYAILPVKIYDYACHVKDPEVYKEACRQTYIKNLPALYRDLDRDALLKARDYAVFLIDPDEYKKSPSYDPRMERGHIYAPRIRFHQKLYELLGERGWIFEPTEAIASPRPEFIEEDLIYIESLLNGADGEKG